MVLLTYKTSGNWSGRKVGMGDGEWGNWICWMVVVDSNWGGGCCSNGRMLEVTLMAACGVVVAEGIIAPVGMAIGYGWYG